MIALDHAGNVAGVDCKLTVDHELRIVSIVAFLMLLDENVQVNGYVFIMDFTGFTMKHFTRWSMEDMKKWNTSWQVRAAREKKQKDNLYYRH
jgi:hypothetical protein